MAGAVVSILQLIVPIFIIGALLWAAVSGWLVVVGILGLVFILFAGGRRR